MRFHFLDEPEHFLRAFIIRRSIRARFVQHPVIAAIEFHRVKPAFVDVKMNVPLLEIGGAGLPYLGFGVKCFNCLPRAVGFARYSRR